MTDSEFVRLLVAAGIDRRNAERFAADGCNAANPFAVALRLATTHGFRVMPSNRHKIPPAGWPENASADAAQIVQWRRQADQRFVMNWSILCGRENGVVVIDIDGAEGLKHLAVLEAENAPLPRTWRVVSGREGGGLHIWFRLPDGPDDLRNQQSQTTLTDGRKVRWDIRGWHGHTVIVGSKHKSGNRYRWVEGCSPHDCDLAACPAWLWALLPKKEHEGEGATPRPRTTRGPLEKREHDPTSYRIGDGESYGGFENPVYRNAIRYFFKAGTDAPAEVILATLRELIVAAPKGQGRDVSRYLNGPDLPRTIERARNFVKEHQ